MLLYVCVESMWIDPCNNIVHWRHILSLDVHSNKIQKIRTFFFGGVLFVFSQKPNSILCFLVSSFWSSCCWVYDHLSKRLRVVEFIIVKQDEHDLLEGIDAHSNHLGNVFFIYNLEVRCIYDVKTTTFSFATNNNLNLWGKI